MIYLDTCCFIKLYYPEPDSAAVAALVQGQVIWYTPLHELEFSNALELKVFFKSATAAQVKAARLMVAQDLANGVLAASDDKLRDVFTEATRLSERHTSVVGCRSLDILHCAAAKLLAASNFMTTDLRQRMLAAEMGLRLIIP